MPQVGREYFKRVELTGYDEPAYVVIVTNPKMDAWDGVDETMGGTQATYSFLANIIREWNFTGLDNMPLAITPENVRLALSAFDMIEIQKHLGFTTLTDAKKKL